MNGEVRRKPCHASVQGRRRRGEIGRQPVPGPGNQQRAGDQPEAAQRRGKPAGRSYLAHKHTLADRLSMLLLERNMLCLAKTVRTFAASRNYTLGAGEIA